MIAILTKDPYFGTDYKLIGLAKNIKNIDNVTSLDKIYISNDSLNSLFNINLSIPIASNAQRWPIQIKDLAKNKSYVNCWFTKIGSSCSNEQFTELNDIEFDYESIS